MRAFAVIVAVIALAFFAFVSFMPTIDDTTRRCQIYAESVVPVGLGTEKYMSVWRACMARNAAR